MATILLLLGVAGPALLVLMEYCWVILLVIASNNSTAQPRRIVGNHSVAPFVGDPLTGHDGLRKALHVTVGGTQNGCLRVWLSCDLAAANRNNREPSI